MDNNLADTPADSLFTSIKLFMEQEANPFLTQYLKTQMLRQIKNQHCQLALSYLPQQIKQKVQQLCRIMHNLKNEKSKDYERYASMIDQFLQKLNPLVRLWAGAKEFFELEIMTEVDPKLQQAIFSKMQSEKQSDIRIFIKESFDKNGNFEMLKKQIQQAIIDNQDNLNLNELVTIIVQKRPKKMGIFERLKNDGSSLKSKIITIKHQSSQMQIEGQIKQIDFQNDTIKLVLLNQRRSKNVKMKLNQDLITDVQAQLEIQCSFQKKMHSLLTPPGQTLTCELRYFSEHLTQNAVIPQGRYSVTAVSQSAQNNYKLQFTEKFNNKRYCFQVDLKDTLFSGKVTYLECDSSTKIFSWKQFVSLYRFYKIQAVVFSYNSKQGNELNIGIRNKSAQEEADHQNTLKTIQSIKQSLSNYFFNQRKHIFQKLIDLAFSNKLNTQIQEFKDIQSQVTQIISLQKRINRTISRQQLLLQLISKANFQMITNKPQSYGRAQKLALLTEAEQAASTLKGRDVLFFYGDTGSGKSTSINYFLGTPLKSTERYGEKVIQISTDNENLQQSLQFSRIGHSSCTSQTLYTKGYAINPQKYKKVTINLDNIALADNPGFRETRGVRFQTCTHYSMQKAIDACERIRGIILVVPQDTIYHGRGNNLLELIFELEKKFPNLLKTQGGVYPYFRILITKQSTNIQAIKRKLSKFSRDLQAEPRNDNNVEDYSFNRRRIAFQVLERMVNEDKVHVIQIDNRKKRQPTFQKFLSPEGFIPKEEYRSALKSNEMIKNFRDQISSSAQTGTDIVLIPYLQTIPNKIKQSSSKLKQLSQELNSNKLKVQKISERVTQNLSVLEAKKNQLPHRQAYLARLLKREIKEHQFSEFKLEFEQAVINMPGYAQRRSFLQHFKKIVYVLISQARAKKAYLEHKREELVQLLKTEENNVAAFKLSIRILNQTYENQLILKRKYQIKEEVVHSQESFTEEQHRDSFLKQFRSSLNNKTTIAGSQKISICSKITIQRQKLYKLNYPEYFDPKKLIKKAQNAFFAKNNEIFAFLQARNTRLYAFKFTKSDSQISMGIVQDFIITQNQKDLPFLRIVLKIPGSICNRQEIENFYSCIRICQQEIIAKSLQIEEAQSKMKLIQHELKNGQTLLERINSEIQEHEEVNNAYKKKLLNQLKHQDREHQIKVMTISEQEAIKVVKSQITSLEQLISTDKKTIQTKDQEISDLLIKQQKQQKQFEMESRRHRKLAFLIQSQINRSIPEALQYFCRFALSKINQQRNQAQPNEESLSLRSAEKRFKSYSSIYQKVRSQLKGIVSRHLTENKFDYEASLLAE